MRFRNSSNVRVVRVCFFCMEYGKSTKNLLRKFNSSQLQEQAGAIAYVVHFSAVKKYLQTVEKFNNYKIWYTNKISLILYIFFRCSQSHRSYEKNCTPEIAVCGNSQFENYTSSHFFIPINKFQLFCTFPGLFSARKIKDLSMIFFTHFLMKFFIVILTLGGNYFISITERVYVLKSRSGCFCCNEKIELKFKYFSLIFSHIHRVVEKIHSK